MSEEFGERASVDPEFADRAAICFDFADRFRAGFGAGLRESFADAPAEEFVARFPADFCVGMAVLFRIEQSHHGAVEGVAVIGAKTVSAEGATRAAVPYGDGPAGLHECDAEGHEERRKWKFEDVAAAARQLRKRAGETPALRNLLRDGDPGCAEASLGVRAVGAHGRDGNEMLAGFEVDGRAGLGDAVNGADRVRRKRNRK